MRTKVVRRFLLAVIALALLAPAGAQATPFSQAPRSGPTVIDTAVKITSVTKKRTRHGRNRVVAGRVSSRKQACVEGAKVEVYVQEQTSQPKKIGTDKANSDGDFRVSEKISNARGDRTYAYLVPRTLGNATRCEGARSNSVPLSRAQRPRARVQKAGTTVEIWDTAASDEPPPRAIFPETRVYGAVLSSKGKCTELRKLSLYVQKPGKDPKLESGYSDTEGYFSINVATDKITGPLYVRAPKAKRGKRLLCKPDKSNVITT